ncbi:uncharacterized protein [Ptychodera flava]|uniref:uncharacterized protein n=1 Tax=Ptychodera flava TaxID=63121 RepID=UPI003969E3F9
MAYICHIISVFFLSVSWVFILVGAKEDKSSVVNYVRLQVAPTDGRVPENFEYESKILEKLNNLNDIDYRPREIKALRQDRRRDVFGETWDEDWDEDYYASLQKQASLGVVFSKTKPTMLDKDVDEVFSGELSHPDSNSFTKRSRGTVLSDTCLEVSDYELVENASNQFLRLVSVHPNTWVYVTRCLQANTSCRGLQRFNVSSACAKKKGWAKALVKNTRHGIPYGDYHWEWIAVDRACSCAVAL